MVKEAHSTQFPPLRLPGFAPAIARLKGIGLPARRLAELFETNENHIYVLAHRGQPSKRRSNATTLRAAPADPLTVEQINEEKKKLGIRAEEGGVELTSKKIRDLEWLESQMREIVSRGRSTYQFLQGAQQLIALKSYIGYPSESKRLKLAGRLHQYLAWFYTHSGMAASCIAEADRSIQLYEIVYQDTGDKDALRLLGGSCLIKSNSLLNVGRGYESLDSLDLSKEVTLAANRLLNSENYQQRGVALFQSGNDDEAAKMFEQARKAAADVDVNASVIREKMTSDRYLNLIKGPLPKIEEELQLLGEARAAYGSDSLEAIMCAHWAAACGFLSDSKSAHIQALELIDDNHSKILHYGHQATINRLLPISLELPASQRSRWVRFALYQNASASN
jgi:tetratricopeptide (TPR) repeat protein